MADLFGARHAGPIFGRLLTAWASAAIVGPILLTALRSLPTSAASFISSYSSAFLYQWVLDPQRQACLSEATLSSRPLEFPAMDPRLVGLPARYAFAITPSTAGGPNRYGPPGEGILIDGVAKFDLTTGEQVDAWTTDDGWWITSEPTFVPTSEPTFMTDHPTPASSPEPTEVPTGTPSAVPTAVPTSAPTSRPTSTPTNVPTSVPSAFCPSYAWLEGDTTTAARGWGRSGGLTPRGPAAAFGS